MYRNGSSETWPRDGRQFDGLIALGGVTHSASLAASLSGAAPQAPKKRRRRNLVMALAQRRQVASSPSAFSTLAPISAGCMASAAVMYPMDVVRALRMASASDAVYVSTPTLLQNFVRAHGVGGLLRQGVMPEIARATTMRVVQFFSYPLVHEVRTLPRPYPQTLACVQTTLTGARARISPALSQALFASKPSEGTPMTKLCAGMLASAPSALAITPLENAKIALQLDSAKRFNNSMTEATSHLWKRGVFAPYVGLQGVFTRSAVSFGPYIAALPYCNAVTVPAVKDALGDTPLATTLGNLLGGFIAGSLGAAINCPFDLVRTNLQKQAIALAEHPMSSGQIASLCVSPWAYMSVARQIVATRGVSALYMGLAFKVTHIGGVGACNAALIPYFKRLFGIEREVF